MQKILNVKSAEGPIDGESDYVNDFKGLGLMYEVEGGFSCSPRAFKLLEYALNYEGKVSVPEKLPKRADASFFVSKNDVNGK